MLDQVVRPEVPSEERLPEIWEDVGWVLLIYLLPLLITCGTLSEIVLLLSAVDESVEKKPTWASISLSGTCTTACEVRFELRLVAIRGALLRGEQEDQVRRWRNVSKESWIAQLLLIQDDRLPVLLWACEGWMLWSGTFSLDRITVVRMVILKVAVDVKTAGHSALSNRLFACTSAQSSLTNCCHCFWYFRVDVDFYDIRNGTAGDEVMRETERMNTTKWKYSRWYCCCWYLPVIRRGRTVLAVSLITCDIHSHRQTEWLDLSSCLSAFTYQIISKRGAGKCIYVTVPLALCLLATAVRVSSEWPAMFSEKREVRVEENMDVFLRLSISTAKSRVSGRVKKQHARLQFPSATVSL